MTVLWSRTHFIDRPEKRNGPDRRTKHCFLANDRRGGVACRRKEAQREMERKIALKKTVFYTGYGRIDYSNCQNNVPKR
jgi:hypothetical protein